MTSPATPVSRSSNPATELRRRAVQRGLLTMPVGLAAGWLLGRSAETEQAATVVAIYLGFGLVPAFAAAVHLGRVASGRMGMTAGASWAAGIVAGLGWGLAGAVLTYGFGLVTTLELQVFGMTILLVGTGLVAGVLGAGLGVALGLRVSRSQRGRRTE